MDIKQIINLGIEEPKAKEIYNKMEQYILEEVRKQTKEYENQILDLKLNMAVERQLFISGAKSIKATIALIDFSKLNNKKIDESLIKQMIDELKTNEETKFLFFEDKDVGIKGFKPLETNINTHTCNRQLSYEELCKYYEKCIF